MPITGRSTGTRKRDTIRDPRAVAVGCAAILGALLGIGQLLVAQFTGVLFHGGDIGSTRQEAVNESSIVIWIAAVAVCLGAVAPRLYLKTRPGRRLRLALSGAAAAGALLSAPVASATAAWAQVYGSGLSQPNVLRLVFFGVVLGAVVAAVAVRSQAAAWSLVCWVGLVWVLLVISAAADPGATPAISHLDPGPDWSRSSRFLQGSLVLFVMAALAGTALGVADRRLHWWRGLRRFRSVAPLLAVCGPLVVLAAYFTAGLASGFWDGGRLATLLAAGMLTAAGSYTGSWAASRLRRARTAGSITA